MRQVVILFVILGCVCLAACTSESKENSATEGWTTAESFSDESTKEITTSSEESSEETPTTEPRSDGIVSLPRDEF